MLKHSSKKKAKIRGEEEEEEERKRQCNKYKRTKRELNVSFNIFKLCTVLSLKDARASVNTTINLF